MSSDLYFEISLMLESLPRNYGVPHANYYFRINRKKPGKEEYRKKVVEFMWHYENTLGTFADTPNYDAFRNYVRSNIEKMVEKILGGEDKDVEKNYRYYIMNEP
ncbi:MAG: hypothetical protein ACE5JV_00390 [Nitrososphaerales archaeon]